jgi:DNA processing protein
MPVRLVPGNTAHEPRGKLLRALPLAAGDLPCVAHELEAAGVSGSAAQSIASGCTFEDAAAQQEKVAETGADRGHHRRPTLPNSSARSSIRRCCSSSADESIAAIADAGRGGHAPAHPYGIAVSERLSGDLSHAGLTIASGMARGIDTASHRGTLAAGGTR